MIVVSLIVVLVFVDTEHAYSEVSIKRPVHLNNLVWIFPKSLYQMTRSISEKNDRTVLFTYLLTVSIKRPGLDIWKKSLLNNPYYIFFQILEA